MPNIKHMVQDLRNAYFQRNGDVHEETLKRLEAWHDCVPADGCTRGQACICNQHAKAVCMYRLPQKK